MKYLIMLAIALLGVAGRSDATIVIHPVWDAIYEYRNFTPREPSYRDNFNTTSLDLPVFKTFDPNQGLYSEDVSMIAFDFRPLRGQSIYSAKLIVVRVDGDLVDPLVASIYRVDDDGVAQREDFFAPGAFASTAAIPPRPSGTSIAEAAIDVTGAVVAAQQSASAFTALRLENAGEFQLDPGNDPFILSSRGEAYGNSNTPRIEVEIVLTAAVDVRPDVINLSNSGRWVTAYLEVPGHDAAEIDPASVRLGGIAPDPKIATIGDHDANGIYDLTLKFPHSAFDRNLVLGMNRVGLTGALVTGERIEGSDSVLAVDPTASASAVATFPNPLNPRGRVRFSIPESGRTLVQLFDTQGRLVRTLMDSPTLTSGVHELSFDGLGKEGAPLGSGVYYLRIESPGHTETGRLVMLK